MFRSFVALSLLFTYATGSYVWPNQEIDELESILYQVNGYRSVPFASEVSPCSNGGPPFLGRQFAAEWLRTSFHDVATHDAAAGTGGIDASLGFEVGRDENKGDALPSSLDFFVNFMNTRASMSDLIALGTVQVMRACGGTKESAIGFRAGRVDAHAPGPTGVPEPSQDLQTHTAQFAKAGFNVSEMIALVACGHTIGGVHGVDFPDIVPFTPGGDPSNIDGTVRFDDTFDVFDNRVAVQFASNSSQDVLAMGANETTNSDKRIFLADGGALIKQFASSNPSFVESCKAVIEKMINTVPKAVKLTDVVKPIAVKPVNVALRVNEGGDSMSFSGEIRLLNVNSSSTVTIQYTSRSDLNVVPKVLPKTNSIPTSTDSNHAGSSFDDSFTFFTFNDSIPTKTSITSFVVEIDDGTKKRVENNGGKGFPIQDNVIVDRAATCLSNTPNEDGTVVGVEHKIVAAVRDAASISSVFASIPIFVNQPGGRVPTFNTRTFPMSPISPSTGGYTMYGTTARYNATVTVGFSAVGAASFDVIGKGKGGISWKDEFIKTADLGSCS